MQTFVRRLVQFVFGLQAISFLPVLPLFVYYIMKHGLHNPQISIASVYTLGGVFSAVGGIYAMAWWTLKQGSRSMHIWGLAGSILNLLLSLPLVFVHHLEALNVLWLLPVAGASGLYLFLTEAHPTAGAATTARRGRIPGDGTHPVTDALAWAAGGVGGICGELWCLRHLHDLDMPRMHGIALYLQVTVIALVVTLIHESGHAFCGWGVGMRLRSFAFGPFEWRIREGRWEFNFDSGKLLASGGATGTVPADPQHQVWQDLLMIFGGPMINLGTGLIALCAGLLLDPDSPWQGMGALLMFGVFSLVGGFFNLLPIRSKTGYSDGARIYQLLTAGPAADVYHAFKFVSSSLVTSLRPGDYDMDLIDRAANVAQGLQLFQLRMFQYQHYLDCQETAEATSALTVAEAAYEQCADEVPAIMITSLVFGTAYVKRDPARARRYWEQMEAVAEKSKKPLRRNADYWIAACALYWSEVRIDLANDAWQQGAALANRLPDAGAYNFDRAKYVVMRGELDKHTAKFHSFSVEPVAGRPALDVAF